MKNSSDSTAQKSTSTRVGSLQHFIDYSQILHEKTRDFQSTLGLLYPPLLDSCWSNTGTVFVAGIFGGKSTMLLYFDHYFETMRHFGLTIGLVGYCSLL